MQTLASKSNAAPFFTHVYSISRQLRWILKREPSNTHTRYIANILSAYTYLDSKDNGYTIHSYDELNIIQSEQLEHESKT
jgi:hypothetical protein